MAVNNSGGIGRPFYNVKVVLMQRDKSTPASDTKLCTKAKKNPTSEKGLDITAYMNKIEIIKSVSLLAPVVVLSFAPPVLDVLTKNIIEEDYFRIEIFRTDSQGQNSRLVFKGDVFVDDFEMKYSVVQKNGSNLIDPLMERTELTFFCKPTYFNKLLKHPVNEVIDVKDKNVTQFAMDLMNKTWEDFDVEFKPNANDPTVKKGYNKASFVESKVLVHKTPLVDYLKYLQQRWGFFKQAALLFSDFPALPKAKGNTSGYSNFGLSNPTVSVKPPSEIGQIFLYSYGYIIKEMDPSFAVVIKSASKDYEQAPGQTTINTVGGDKSVPVIYVDSHFEEKRELPKRIMRTKTKVNFMSVNRDQLFDVDRRNFFSSELQDIVRTRKTPIYIRDFWELEKSIMTNTISNGKVHHTDADGKGCFINVPTEAEAGYFGDQFTTFQVFSFKPGFWVPWDYVATIGQRVRLKSDVTEYIKRFDGEKESDYLFYKARLLFSRQTGGGDIWVFNPEITLARQ